MIDDTGPFARVAEAEIAIRDAYEMQPVTIFVVIDRLAHVNRERASYVRGTRAS